MPSPFPGMDPYIESSGMWGDFHGSLLAAIRGDLNAHLPRGYAASIELFVWAGEAGSHAGTQLGEPDVFVREDDRPDDRGAATATMAAPSTIVLPRLARRKRKYIKVVDVRAKKVITVVEVLSPSNKKSGADRAAYLEKRNEYLASNLSFVEIDLLRAGRRPPLGKRHPEVADYYAMACRSWEFPRAGFWTFGVRDPLPEIPVPVTRELGDTPLNLRACVDTAYDSGRYATSLPYDEPLKPRPRDEDRDWIAQRLKKVPR
jgi:hypothetical protein